METITKHTGCPCCRSKPLPEDEQPGWGTHAFSRRYDCGAQIVYVIEGRYWEWEKECPDQIATKAEISDDN